MTKAELEKLIAEDDGRRFVETGDGLEVFDSVEEFYASLEKDGEQENEGKG